MSQDDEVISVELEYSELKGFLAESHLAVIDFYMVGCGHCQTMAPIFERMAGKFSSKAAFAKLDVLKFKQAAYDYDIYGTPTFIGFRDGVKTTTMEGDIPEDEFERKVAKFLNGG